FKIEGELQFADDHDRGFAAAERHEVATADLALDRKAELLEKSLDRQIECGFQRRFLISDWATHWLKSTPDHALACCMIAVNAGDSATWGTLRTWLRSEMASTTSRVEMLDGVKGGNQGVMVVRAGTLRGGDSFWKGEITNLEHTPSFGERPIWERK